MKKEERKLEALTEGAVCPQCGIGAHDKCQSDPEVGQECLCRDPSHVCDVCCREKALSQADYRAHGGGGAICGRNVFVGGPIEAWCWARGYAIQRDRAEKAEAENTRLDEQGRLLCADIQRLHEQQRRGLEDWTNLRTENSSLRATAARAEGEKK